MEEYTFQKKVMERYDIRFGYEWAVIMLSEDGGLFSAHTSYGDYTYAWPHHGRKSFKHFVMNELTRDTYYFLGKVSSKTTFDHETSLKNWKRTVIEQRRDGNLSADQARDLWKELTEIAEEYMSIEAAQNALFSSNVISDCGFDSYYDFTIETDYPTEAKIFASRIMPILGDILKKELEEKTE